MTPSKSLYDLLEAMSEAGCPICRLVDMAAERYIDHLLWELVNDPGTRHGIREARGFCHPHSWKLVRGGASLGVAIVMRDVLIQVLEVLATGTYQAPAHSLRSVGESLLGGKGALANAATIEKLSPRVPCPVCKHCEEMQETYLLCLITHLPEENGLKATYETSDGLCLPHLRLSIALADSEELFRNLVSSQHVIWSRLKRELDEFIRKNDYRFQNEPLGREGDSWQRVIAGLAGSLPRNAGRSSRPSPGVK